MSVDPGEAYANRSTRSTVGTLLLPGALLGLVAISVAFFSPWIALAGVASLLLMQTLLVVRSAYSLLPLLAAAVLFQPLSGRPLSVATVTVYPIDLALVMIGLLWLALRIKRKQPLVFPKGHGYLLLICVALVEPMVVGLARANGLQSAIAPARGVAYYLSVYVLIWLIKDARGAMRVLAMILALSCVAALYLVYTRIQGIAWVNGMSGVQLSNGTTVSRGYGWWSATPWYPAGSLVALSYAWLSDATGARRLIAGSLALALMVATLSTLIRGDLVALLAGVVLISLQALGVSRLSKVARRRVAVTVVVVGLIGISFYPLFGRTSIAQEIVSRTKTFFATGTSAAGTSSRDFRFHGVSAALGSAVSHPLGLGYGHQGAIAGAESAQVDMWSQHISVAWLAFYGGLFSLLVAVLAVLGLTREVIARVRGAATEYVWVVTAASAMLGCLLVESLDSDTLFAEQFAFPLVVVLLAVVFSFERNSHNANENQIWTATRV